MLRQHGGARAPDIAAALGTVDVEALGYVPGTAQFIAGCAAIAAGAAMLYPRVVKGDQQPLTTGDALALAAPAAAGGLAGFCVTYLAQRGGRITSIDKVKRLELRSLPTRIALADIDAAPGDYTVDALPLRRIDAVGELARERCRVLHDGLREGGQRGAAYPTLMHALQHTARFGIVRRQYAPPRADPNELFAWGDARQGAIGHVETCLLKTLVALDFAPVRWGSPDCAPYVRRLAGTMRGVDGQPLVRAQLQKLAAPEPPVPWESMSRGAQRAAMLHTRITPPVGIDDAPRQAELRLRAGERGQAVDELLRTVPLPVHFHPVHGEWERAMLTNTTMRSVVIEALRNTRHGGYYYNMSAGDRKLAEEVWGVDPPRRLQARLARVRDHEDDADLDTALSEPERTAVAARLGEIRPGSDLAEELERIVASTGIGAWGKLGAASEATYQQAAATPWLSQAIADKGISRVPGAAQQALRNAGIWLYDALPPKAEPAVDKIAAELRMDKAGKKLGRPLAAYVLEADAVYKNEAAARQRAIQELVQNIEELKSDGRVDIEKTVKQARAAWPQPKDLVMLAALESGETPIPEDTSFEARPAALSGLLSAARSYWSESNEMRKWRENSTSPMLTQCLTERAGRVVDTGDGGIIVELIFAVCADKVQFFKARVVVPEELRACLTRPTEPRMETHLAELAGRSYGLVALPEATLFKTSAGMPPGASGVIVEPRDPSTTRQPGMWGSLNELFVAGLVTNAGMLGAGGKSNVAMMGATQYDKYVKDSPWIGSAEFSDACASAGTRQGVAIREGLIAGLGIAGTVAGGPVAGLASWGLGRLGGVLAGTMTQGPVRIHGVTPAVVNYLRGSIEPDDADSAWDSLVGYLNLGGVA